VNQSAASQERDMSRRDYFIGAAIWVSVILLIPAVMFAAVVVIVNI
jgi:hypothetical protein